MKDTTLLLHLYSTSVVTRDASSTWRQSRADINQRSDDYEADNGDEKELASAALEPSLMVTHTSDYFSKLLLDLTGSCHVLVT